VISPLPYTLVPLTSTALPYDEGGLDLPGRTRRTVNALAVTATAAIDTAATALIAAPLTVAKGVVSGATKTVAALGAGTDPVTALAAGVATVGNSVFAPAGASEFPDGGAVTQVVDAIARGRTKIYAAVTAPSASSSAAGVTTSRATAAAPRATGASKAAPKKHRQQAGKSAG
jgi:hypothetical protein